MRKLLLSSVLIFVFGVNLALTQSVRINEVGTTVTFEGETTWVELKNTGDSDVDVSGLLFCSEFRYPGVGDQKVLSGSPDFIIPAGEFLVVSINELSESADELGLYQANTGNFGNPDNIIDYIQYIDPVTGRDAVAESAGIWVADEAVPPIETEQTYSFFEDSNDDPVDNWKAGTPTPGEPNEEATSTAVDDVNTVADEFEIIGNFPNPFNPSTTIQFNLPSAASVELQVYNVIGSEVMSMDAGRFSAGSANQINVNAQTLASGTYVYRLTARTSSQVLTVSDTFTLIK